MQNLASDNRGPLLLEKGILHEIPFINENETVPSTQYRIPYKLNKCVYQVITRFLSEGIIRPSNSHFGLPAFVIPKKPNAVYLQKTDWQYKNPTILVSVYGRLYKNFPQGREIFSNINLRSGNHQIAINEENILQTAFIMENSRYKFTRLIFGLAAEPMRFQTQYPNIWIPAFFRNLLNDL
jgi:hypothetical protein